MLAILEKGGVISPIYSNKGFLTTSAGTVSAGYQNFLVCIEMFFASLALRCAFPHTVYKIGFQTDGYGRSVTMQSISSSLKVRFYVYIFICKIFLVMILICGIKSSSSFPY